jgi:hypothetical protein
MNRYLPGGSRLSRNQPLAATSLTRKIEVNERPQRQKSKSSGICQSCAMGVSEFVIQPIDEGNFEASVRFLTEWVSDGEAEAEVSG